MINETNDHDKVIRNLVSPNVYMHIIPIFIITYLEASQPVQIITDPYFSIFPYEVFKVCVLPSNATTGFSYNTFKNQNNKIHIKMVTLHLSQ
jgi:hypothetical protein